jgi:hypothetical protein
MPLGEHEAIVEKVVSVLRMELHSNLVEEKHGEDVCDGGGGGGVAALGDPDCPAGIDAELVANILPERVVDLLLHLLVAAVDALGRTTALRPCLFHKI